MKRGARGVMGMQLYSVSSQPKIKQIATGHESAFEMSHQEVFAVDKRARRAAYHAGNI